MLRCTSSKSRSDFRLKSASRWWIRCRASRSVCSNIGEAWRKRRYPAHFASKLSDSEGEGEETRVWLDLALRCGYISEAEAGELDQVYDGILGQLVRMIERPEQWSIRKQNQA